MSLIFSLMLLKRSEPLTVQEIVINTLTAAMEFQPVPNYPLCNMVPLPLRAIRFLLVLPWRGVLINL